MLKMGYPSLEHKQNKIRIVGGALNCGKFDAPTEKRKRKLNRQSQLRKNMEKLIIAGRTNWEKGFYIKFKAEEKSMKIIKKIVEDLGSEYFVDNQIIPKIFSEYEKWKD